MPKAVFVEGLELSYGICFIFNGTKFGIRTFKKCEKDFTGSRAKRGLFLFMGAVKSSQNCKKISKKPYIISSAL